MGISERREREKIERRKAILNCAKELILLQGVERVSMEDIARKAELSKATVYLYFSGKDILLKEICEESARIFLEYFKSLLGTSLSGIATLQRLWRSYVELFGDSHEMIIIFQLYNFMNPGLPFVSLEEQGKSSSSVEGILNAVKAVIDQCKAEGIFDPELDSTLATRLLLSMFSIIVEQASRIPPEARKSTALIEEMTKSFQIIIRGFARENIDRSCLDITETL